MVMLLVETGYHSSAVTLNTAAVAVAAAAVDCSLKFVSFITDGCRFWVGLMALRC
jgi:hypothetical protein